MTDEQRVERCMEISKPWHCSLQKGHQGNHRAYKNHDITTKMLEEWPNQDDAASRLPKGESKRHDEVTADDEPEIFALLDLHRANVEASSSPEAKQAFMDTMRFLLELAKVRHATKAATPAPEAAPQTFEEWWISKEAPSVDGIHSLRAASYEAIHDNLKNWLEIAWNAAKASSPAALSPAVRMQLWLTHGCGFTSLYGDDGEMQCNRAPFIDFKRGSEADILAGMAKHKEQRRLAEASSPAVVGGESEEQGEVHVQNHFNQLTPFQLERLAILSEELGEAQQIIGKILRHGLMSHNPNDSSAISNRGLLAQELGDVLYAIDCLMFSKDIEGEVVQQHRRLKAEKVKPYLHHQIDVAPLIKDVRGKE